ncbi:LOW QUALITY PROTEIN: replication protein A 70 kDa DNA-binding subunit E-like [Carica papaya]|uniref:LOW QUALITY PROTEIN: replication protein A 70 kDa DNA-binding subunit E-like n=1 Tax=Carica papaya TaxID=3649 RepID=UPI000B8CBCFF|nr:LOW QUALITY PROTEIN: replication protein A 70 kDa DNA-binding subunit E-like [Carica papaya]
MAVNLTEGAVEKMAKGELASEKDMTPVLQVTELKLVQSRLQQQQQQEPPKERFRLVLSDGTNLQQGMLGTSKNELVKNGSLQIGSVIQLTQFVCSVIQGRRIVIVVELVVILEKYDILGNPVAMPRPAEPGQAFTEQPGKLTGNPQSFGGSSLSGGLVDKPNAGGSSVQQPRTNQLQSNYLNNSDSGRYPPTSSPLAYPKAELGSRFPESAPPHGVYGDQRMGFRNPGPDVSRPLPTTYNRPPDTFHQRAVQPMYVNRGPVARNEAPARIIPIAALNPYQGRWTIKARVTSKGELRHYNNPRGDGKVFSFDLLDADGGEIRVTCFNAVADQFYNQIEAGKVYLFSKGSLKPAQKNFNHLNNDFEIYLESTSTVQPCFEDNISIPQQRFHFRLISDVEGMENNSVVDVIGVVSSISPTSSIMRKNGTETQKRILQLKDTSGRSVELTLWGNFCNAEGQTLQNLCDSGVYPVLAVKSGRVNDFNGKAVGTISTSQLFIEPDFPEAHKLKQWFDKEGRSTPSISISKEVSSVGKADARKTISQIKDERLGTSEKPDWITVSATIIYMKSDNFCYTACPIMIGDRPCNKKVTNNGDGKWRCDRCDQCVDECDYRYIIQFQVQDHTGITWVTAFQEAGEDIMGISAKDLYYLKYENQDDEKYAEVIRRVVFMRYVFKLKIKEETFSDEQRVKATVVKAEKVNYSFETRFLLDMMNKLKERDSSCFSMKVDDGSNLNPGMSNTGNLGRRQPAVGGSTANQAGQYGNEYGSSRIHGVASPGFTGCNRCGSSSHNPTNCPSSMSSLGQSMGGSYVNRVSPGGGSGSSTGVSFSTGRYGGTPGQQVGGY